MSNFLLAAQQFTPQGQVLDVREYGQGNINATFLVTLAAGVTKNFILQRLNTRVFPRPELIMQNLRTFTAHMRGRLRQESLPPGRRWEVPEVLLTRSGQDHWLDPEGAFWRALSFIEDAQSQDTIRDLGHAAEVGYALGRFHHLLSDLPPESLADTLPGFHLMPSYLRHYDGVIAANPGHKSPEADFCHRFVRERRHGAGVLEEAKAAGKLPVRTIHGDPKVNNVLLDAATGRAVALVDLDTVKPGLVHYDLGDCLRSACNPLGEETGDWQKVRFEPEICRALLRGYLSQARDFLIPGDYGYLFDAIRLLTFELGLRFFTDYLAGSLYFKARSPEHNLARALVQFRLTESIESQEGVIRGIIKELPGREG
ncbi:MAG: phosphotransferase enzyme family protein [Desulfobaccales bacterium]